MSLTPAQIEELRGLLARCDDVPLTPAETERLNELLASDGQAQQMFADFAMLNTCLDMVWTSGERHEAGEAAFPEFASPQNAMPVVPAFPVLHAPVSALHSPFGNFVLSYGVAATVVAVGLLIGWACRVSIPSADHQQAANDVPRPRATPVIPLPRPVFVARITGMVACRWADPRTAPVGFDRVALGRKYSLVSGLVEIVYDTGGRIILQGPCDYEVESKTGGFLALGRVTAKVEKRGGGRGDGGESLKIVGRRPPNEEPRPSPPSPLPSPLFFVRTPSATVTDLGTEFGVEVDKSGVSKAHVYRGKVELRVGVGSSAKVVPLGENESARVASGKQQTIDVVREPAQRVGLVRVMPRRIAIRLFNTGVNLDPGDPDPNWQLVARSDDAKFQPRPAEVVNMTNSYWVVNQRDRSQWISVRGGELNYNPDDVVFTFRTAFDLTGMRPDTAILHVRFAVDNHIRAMRLNGQPVSVPRHEYEDFAFLQSFSLRRGFVEGANQLEVEVENTDPAAKSPASFMGLLMELDGSAVTAWSESPTTDGKEDKHLRK
jgi:hypothetical protein